MTTDKVMDTLIYILIFVAVLPVIGTAIVGVTNITGAALILLALVPLFVVWGAIQYIRKQSKGRN